MARADHIYVSRFNGVYNHHGIDYGDGTVIHYTNQPRWSQFRIERTPLEEFCHEASLQVRDYAEFRRTVAELDMAEQLVTQASQRLNQLLDALRGLAIDELDFSDDAVIARAESRLGESSYDLISNNCEHFAAWCKTGISSSSQIDAIWRQSLTRTRFLRRRMQHFMTGVFENPWLR